MWSLVSKRLLAGALAPARSAWHSQTPRPPPIMFRDEASLLLQVVSVSLGMGVRVQELALGCRQNLTAGGTACWA
jgi:hypothetical protein